MDDYFLVNYLDSDNDNSVVCRRKTRHIHETLLVLKYVKDYEIEVEIETENDVVSGYIQNIVVHTGDERETLTVLDVYMYALS